MLVQNDASVPARVATGETKTPRGEFLADAYPELWVGLSTAEVQETAKHTIGRRLTVDELAAAAEKFCRDLDEMIAGCVADAVPVGCR
jgi:hypothetical protein